MIGDQDVLCVSKWSMLFLKIAKNMQEKTQCNMCDSKFRESSRVRNPSPGPIASAVHLRMMQHATG